MINSKIKFICFICFGIFISSCAEKFDPVKEAEKDRNEIISSAPISFEYKIKEPREDTPKKLKAFSGHWVGRWNELLATQLVITEINSTNVTFIYTWAANPGKNIEAGSFTDTIDLDNHDRIYFQKNGSIITFVVDTLLNKVIGVKMKDDVISNIVMEKVR